ncbi:hypothetical protein ANCDUO_22036 [Ancylostoma duodenale]|uniref:Uncharacterized protein n=1 Tax=Ancylostoma duodenale TaxID=51022 RepID=A0A0C2FMK4_9BILA|nr:hypothetical protein ANCDUO_22036 [Ancylostoma duodenale]
MVHEIHGAKTSSKSTLKQEQSERHSM